MKQIIRYRNCGEGIHCAEALEKATARRSGTRTAYDEV